MSLKPVYIQAPGSKQTTIQIEMKANCTIRDINTFLCSTSCVKSEPVNNPHQAAYLAFLIDQLRIGIQAVRAKKDNPIQMSYSVYDGMFIATISFISDNASFRLVGKMMASKCFQKNVKPAIQMISQVDKEFLKQYGRDVVEDAIKFMQRDVSIFVMSKMPKNKFEGGKDAFGTKVLTQKFNDAADKLDRPKANPIPTKALDISKDVYTSTFIDVGVMDEIHRSLFLASLNGQRVEYVVFKKELRIKQKDLPNSGKELCIKFMKERLGYTKKEKNKTFKSLTAEQKSKTSEKEFDEKQKSKREKKDMALIQTLSQSGAVPMDILESLRRPLASYQFSNIPLTKIKDLIDTLVKNHK